MKQLETTVFNLQRKKNIVAGAMENFNLRPFITRENTQTSSVLANPIDHKDFIWTPSFFLRVIIQIFDHGKITMDSNSKITPQDQLDYVHIKTRTLQLLVHGLSMYDPVWIMNKVLRLFANPYFNVWQTLMHLNELLRDAPRVPSTHDGAYPVHMASNYARRLKVCWGFALTGRCNKVQFGDCKFIHTNIFNPDATNFGRHAGILQSNEVPSWIRNKFANRKFGRGRGRSRGFRGRDRGRGRDPSSARSPCRSALGCEPAPSYHAARERVVERGASLAHVG